MESPRVENPSWLSPVAKLRPELWSSGRGRLVGQACGSSLCVVDTQAHLPSGTWAPVFKAGSVLGVTVTAQEGLPTLLPQDSLMAR